MTLVTTGSDAVIAQINAQLLKLVDVVAVEDMTGGNTLARELLLIKLQLAAQHAEAADALVRRAGGRVLSSNPSIYIVELAGTAARDRRVHGKHRRLRRNHRSGAQRRPRHRSRAARFEMSR